jgi:hypothetical protein
MLVLGIAAPTVTVRRPKKNLKVKALLSDRAMVSRAVCHRELLWRPGGNRTPGALRRTDNF